MEKKLYVGNLPFSMGQEELKNLFSPFGEISEVLLITDKRTGRSKGFGFVTFSNSEDADKAIGEMNGKEVEGREIKVSEARPFQKRSGGFGRRRFRERR